LCYFANVFSSLETGIDELMLSRKSSTFVGIGGIIVPLFLGYFEGLMMDLTNIQSWFLGVSLSATSVIISVQALKEMNHLKTPEGTTILGAAIIDDVVVMIIMAFLIRKKHLKLRFNYFYHFEVSQLNALSFNSL